MYKLLLVDDSFTARSIVSRILGDQFDLTAVSSGPEALDLLATTTPNLILLDLLMPGMDGFAVLEVLRTRENRIPVLVLSADIQHSTRERVRSLGAIDIVNKPLRPESFRKAVMDALAGVAP
jgi:CheY-like chemotaxis protein